MKRLMGNDIFRYLKGMRVLIALVLVSLAVLLLAEGIALGQSKSKKIFGFSDEILPINIDEEEPVGISAESFEERARAKKEMITQKTDKEELMIQLKQQPKQAEAEVPLKKKVSDAQETEGAAREQTDTGKKETLEEKAAEALPEVIEAPKVEPVKPEIIEPELGEADEVEPAETLKPRDIAVPMGSILLVKTSAEGSVKVYEWLEKHVSAARKDIASETLSVNMEEMPEELRVSLEPLLEVEGVKIEVPGADYAVAKDSKVAPIMEYDVKDEIFTIDEITLEKKKTGELLMYVPRNVKKDFSQKVLCLGSEKDALGKTIKQRLEEGDVKALAMVLAEWARYEKVGFKFSVETEEVVAKAVIRAVGVGVGDAVVRLEDSEVSSKALEDEISKIVGGDKKAWNSIMEFIYPKAKENGFKAPYKRVRK